MLFLLNLLSVTFAFYCASPPDFTALSHCSGAQYFITNATTPTTPILWVASAPSLATYQQIDHAVGIEFGHIDGDMTKDRIDWASRQESQQCKAAWLSLLCSYALPPCAIQVESNSVDDDAEYHQRASLRDRVFAECSEPETMWTKPYPDNGNNASTFDLIIDADTTCFPDGSGGVGQECKKAIDEGCDDNIECWSSVCDAGAGICAGRVEGDSCHSDEGCFGGACGSDYRCTTACLDDRACTVGSSCVDGACTSGASVATVSLALGLASALASFA